MNTNTEKIYVVDHNMGSILKLMSEDKNMLPRNINFIFLQQFPINPIQWGNIKLIINPSSSIITGEHWKNIKTFIEKAKNFKILLLTPSLTEEEVKVFLGKQSHIKILGMKEHLGDNADYKKIINTINSW